MSTPTQTRRQRIDAAEAALERAHAEQGTAEAREMRLTAELAIASQRVIDATQATDSARRALAEALAYQDPQPAAPGDVHPHIPPQAEFIPPQAGFEADRSSEAGVV